MTKKTISRAVLAVMTAGMLLVPFTPTSASAAGANEDKVKCVIQAIKENTGIYWCFATLPPDA